jgi:WD domain, G-beta repeat
MLRKAGYAEIQRIIREEEPPKPSRRLSSLGADADEVARRRGSDVRTIVRLLRDDLEWITLKALEKDRSRRYASASEFAADIARHIAHEPVLAGPPGVVYRTRKFAQRYKRTVVAVIAIALTVLTCAVVSFALYLQAVRQQKAVELSNYSANLSAADLQLRAGQPVDARNRLAATPASLRGWEWRYLMASTDKSTASMYSTHQFVGFENVWRNLEMLFSEDGTKLFCYGDSFLRSWDTTTKRLDTDLSGLGRVLAIGPHGHTVLIGPQPDYLADPPREGYVLRLYGVKPRRALKEFRGLTMSPGLAEISHDGDSVSASQQPNQLDPTSIIVWNAHTSAIIARLEVPSGWVTDLRPSPDSHLLAATSQDFTVRLWDLKGSVGPLNCDTPHGQL